MVRPSKRSLEIDGVEFSARALAARQTRHGADSLVELNGNHVRCCRLGGGLNVLDLCRHTLYICAGIEISLGRKAKGRELDLVVVAAMKCHCLSFRGDRQVDALRMAMHVLQRTDQKTVRSLRRPFLGCPRT